MALIICIIVAVVLVAVFLNTYEGKELTSLGSSGSNAPGMSFTQKGGVNNPGFLIHTITKWKGKTDSEGCKFENFSSMPYGVRAWYINLFGKVKDGRIKTITQMIDVLTPAGSENSEAARNNYKASVTQAHSWLELGMRVFNFEANPDWVALSQAHKNEAIQLGLAEAVKYCYGSNNLPQLIPAQ